MLVAAFSAVAAFGTLAGLSGVQGDGHGASGARTTGTVAVGVETPVSTDDSVWD
ncbi:hypothetical protein SAMN05216532_4473 [Streptomyces sp. 2231.1]|nr:hypothetical protein SAMN05216532_4473 [Streptomyces sp. 2231.1]